jgi:RNA polymerase sigma-70 factor (ECF subfamily)
MTELPLRVVPECGADGEPPPAADWARIAQGCSRQDPQAFEQLVHLTQDRLRRLIGRVAGVRADLDELVQETYLRAWRSIGRFRGDSSLETWLTRIAVNVAITWKRGLRPVVPLGKGAEHLKATPAIGDQALFEAMEQALGRLSPDLRAVFVLHENEALSYRAIAEVMDCPIGTVMSRLHRAREQLMSELRDRLDEMMP